MWSIYEYELGEKAKIRLWKLINQSAHFGKQLIIKMEDGEIDFYTKEFVKTIPLVGNIHDKRDV